MRVQLISQKERDMESQSLVVPDWFVPGGALLALFLSVDLASAQGKLTVLNTGGEEPLVSEVRPLFVAAGSLQPRLLFNFGFATDENSGTETFLDSFTVTIQDVNQVFTAIYFTADAAGTVLAPPTPGAIVIDPATLSTNALDYPSLNPILLNQRAYAVIALLPAQFIGRQINVYFDLFDNLNAIGSQTWFSDLALEAVPEPQAWSLLLLAGAAAWRPKRLRT
jgi:hypothetical protein